jgi:hypothetical protein
LRFNWDALSRVPLRFTLGYHTLSLTGLWYILVTVLLWPPTDATEFDTFATMIEF